MIHWLWVLAAGIGGILLGGILAVGFALMRFCSILDEEEEKRDG